MTYEELVKHLRAYSQTYSDDAKAVARKHGPIAAQFYSGKAEAFATAAEWLELVIGGNK